MITATVKPMEDIINEELENNNIKGFCLGNNDNVRGVYFKTGESMVENMHYGEKIIIESSDSLAYDYKEVAPAKFSFQYKEEWLLNIKEEKKEMTVAEIEKKLGHQVKIVK